MYVLIKRKYWKHVSGKKASIYGACPWFSDSEKDDWKLVTDGWTVENTKTGDIGRVNRKIPDDFEEAQKVVDELNELFYPSEE